MPRLTEASLLSQDYIKEQFIEDLLLLTDFWNFNRDFGHKCSRLMMLGVTQWWLLLIHLQLECQDTCFQCKQGSFKFDFGQAFHTFHSSRAFTHLRQDTFSIDRMGDWWIKDTQTNNPLNFCSQSKSYRLKFMIFEEPFSWIPFRVLINFWYWYLLLSDVSLQVCHFYSFEAKLLI